MNELPCHEQQLILAHILKKSREYVLTHPETQLTEIQEKKYEKLMERRLNHEPMAYLLGHKEFYGLDFKVTPDTLIPRPETELLVEKALEKMRLTGSQTPSTVIDIGTGSGNVIISLTRNSEQEAVNRKSNLRLFGTDISAKALKVSRHNAKKNNVEKKIKFIKSDLLEYFIKNKKGLLKNKKIIFVANLPYLSGKIYSATLPDVKNFEPKPALLSGPCGLDHYEKLFQQIKNILLPNKHCSIIIEISPEQKNKLSQLTKKYFPETRAVFHRDLAKKWRVCQIDMQ